MTPVTYADRAILYAQRCVDDQETVCAETRRAAQRMLDDLKDQKQWRYDRKLADHACRFIEMLPIIDGGPDRNIVLDDWQCFIVCNIFGWVGDGGLRRFIYATLFIGRGNGKSFLFSAIALYVVFGTGQTGAEGYTAATAKQTSKIVFETCSTMMSLRPKLTEKLGIHLGAAALTNALGCRLVPVSSEAKSQFGQRMALGVVDELHQVDPKLYAALAKGLGKRKNGLLFSITTAGDRNEGLAKDKYDLVRKILSGQEESARHFCCIWQAESVDDLHDEREWKKANPALGSFLDPEVLRLEAREAVTHQARQDFIIYRLDRFAGNVTEGWLPPGKWDACTDPSLRIEDFKGRSVYIGLDLAFRRDLCSKVYIFPREEDDGTHYDVFQASYLPQSQLGSVEAFGGWVRQDPDTGEGPFMTATPGDITDLQFIEDELHQDLATYDVRAVCFDPEHAGQMYGNLEKVGAPMVAVPTRTMTLTGPIKMTEEFVLKGRLHHTGDPLFSWCVQNTCAFRSPQGNVFLQKESKKSVHRIDPAIALVTGMKGALEEPQSGFVFVSLADWEESQVSDVHAQ